MNWGKWLEKWEMTSLKLNASFLELEWKPKDEDKSAAWELYIELLTRISTQSLEDNHGDEKTALESVYTLFAITRQILKNNTRNCTEFTKIAVVVLNQVVRPFTAKWHRLSLQGAFTDFKRQNEFREDLVSLQVVIKKYTKMLADMAGVEDLTTLEESEY